MSAEMKPLNTADLFRDKPREDVPMRRKADDQLNYVGPEVGVNLQGLQLPKGAVAGVSLEAVLRRLTVRQREIVRWAARGMSNKQIARQLGISPETVKTHLHHVFEREGVHGRMALLAAHLGDA